ncbi:MAG: hypothetical protein LBB85_08355 [Dysgonamonadaceae bacterium]|jgi:hypothetical protein|nr:hypothetical protein [Dysgonamonadaceae bacterium]
MKKAICVLLLSVFAFAFKVHAQDWNDYVQFGSDFGLVFPGILFQGEYGRAWKWLEVGLSMTYVTDNINGESSAELPVNSDKQTNYSTPISDFDAKSSASLSLNARVDIVWFFTKQSRHALKVGAGLGYEFYNKMFQNYNGEIYSVSMENRSKISPLIQTSYEYDITQKLAIGTFFNYGTFLPSAVGLTVRRTM